MSDKSSESSCEWVLLNENDDLPQENAESQPLNQELNYDSISTVAPEFIKSSLSCEELEWQYDSLEGNSNLSPYDLSYIDDLDLDDESIGKSDIDKIEDIYIDDCTSLNNLKEDIDLNLASVHKTHCYKHNRNEHLNFLLNIMLALALSSAIGFGTGHFLGWSHKCWTNTNELKNDALHYSVPEKAGIKQIVESHVTNEKGSMDKSASSEDLKHSPDWGFDMGSRSALVENCKETLNNNIAADVNLVTNGILKTSISDNADILELPVKNVKLSNFSDLEHPVVLNTIPPIDWSKVSQITLPVKQIYNHVIDFDDKAVIDVDEDLSDFDDETTIDVDEDLPIQDKKINLQSDFKQVNKDEDFTKTTFTNLQEDLIQVIQTLNAIAFSRISHGKEKDSAVADLDKVQKSYADCQSIIVSKISVIDGFIQSEEYKKFPKVGVKHLKKMVYSLVDSFDYIIKTSLRIFGKEKEKINVYKFSKNISKIIFNFDKKWEKNQNIWTKNLERIKNKELKQNIREFKQNSFQEYEEKFYKKKTRYWRRKPFTENYPKHKPERYSMKS